MAAEHAGAEVYLVERLYDHTAPGPFSEVEWSQEYNCVVLGEDYD